MKIAMKLAVVLLVLFDKWWQWTRKVWAIFCSVLLHSYDTVGWVMWHV